MVWLAPAHTLQRCSVCVAPMCPSALLSHAILLLARTLRLAVWGSWTQGAAPPLVVPLTPPTSQPFVVWLRSRGALLQELSPPLGSSVHALLFEPTVVTMVVLER